MRIAAKTKPECEIELYASILLTSFWARAMRFGRVILSTTSVYSVYSTKGLWDFKNMLNTLIITLKAAIFGTIEINAAKSEFEPSYTSGTQV